MKPITLNFSPEKVITFSVPSVIQGISPDSTGAHQTTHVQSSIERNLLTGNASQAAREIRELALGYLRQAKGTTLRKSEEDTIRILQTTIGLSSQLPVGQFAIDQYDRAILSSDWAVSMDWDCDGDPITVVLWDEVNTEQLASQGNHKVTRGMLIKIPPTKLFPIATLVPCPKTVFGSITKDMYDEIINRPVEQLDPLAVMVKMFSIQPIGTVTSRWWSKMLKDAFQSAPDSLVTGINLTLQKHGDAYRSDLEGKVMKGARKGSGAMRPACYDEEIHQMTALSSTIFGSRGAIARTTGLSWSDIEKMLDDKPEFEAQATRYKEATPVADNWTSKEATASPDLVRYLVQSKRIRYEDIPRSADVNKKHVIDEIVNGEVKKAFIPNAKAISLYSTEAGAPCSFVWTRDAGDKLTGYVTVLYPTFCHNPYTGKTQLMCPLQHMALWISRHFTCSLEIKSVNYVDAMFRGEGSRALESVIRKYVETFGDVLPSLKVGESHQLLAVGKFFASQTITIDHSSFPGWSPNQPIEAMIDRTGEASKVCGGIHVASTSSKRIARKHFLADKDGFPSFVIRKEGTTPCQGHRPGRNASLLKRSLCCSKMRTMVVASDSIQCYITPEGIAKSTPPMDTFLREVSYEEKEGFVFHASFTWNGGVRYAWISPNAKQDAKPIGKFVDANGNRFEPRYHESIKVAGQPIDMIMSLKELEEKHLSQLFLSLAKKEIWHSPTGPIEVYVLDWLFFRSGAASENIVPRWLKSWTLTGFVGLMLAASCEQHGVPCTRHNKFLIASAKNLWDAAEQIPGLYAKFGNPLTQ
jgi:hypothetical protein